MPKIKLVVFDLDGTLMEAGDNIYFVTIYTLDHLGIDHSGMTKEEFMKHIGAHFADIFDAFGIVVDFNYFIEYYKKFYFDFIHTTKLYPFVEELLIWLKENNIKSAVLTTKAQDQTELITKHFGLEGYFDYLMGRRPGIGIKPSPEPLLNICTELNIRPEETLFVGDTEIDIQCGKSAGSFTCSVTHGYRHISVLENYNPDYIINSIIEVKDIIDKIQQQES